MLLGIIINCEDMYKYYIHYLLMMKILNLMFLSVLYGVPYDGLTLITDIGQAGQQGMGLRLILGRIQLLLYSIL